MNIININDYKKAAVDGTCALAVEELQEVLDKKGESINPVEFCKKFLQKYKMAYMGKTFYTVDGAVDSVDIVEKIIYDNIKDLNIKDITKDVNKILKALELETFVRDIEPQEDRIPMANGTLFLDGTFTEEKNEVVRNRMNVNYNPEAESPEKWLRFLDELLYPEDIPTLQEYMGYCLIPTNRAQKMLLIKGAGGEGKSQVGTVLKRMMGAMAKDGSLNKLASNQFARADLENVSLMVDDDMDMVGLKSTNYVKSIITSNGKMDLERKGVQSYQGNMFARLLVFSNGDLEALHDTSDGFYRRQLILTTKPKSANRVDDTSLIDKLSTELEGIFLWAFEGLKRLIENKFKFTESERAVENREMAKTSANSFDEFLRADDYVSFGEEECICTSELYRIYREWCDDNAVEFQSPRCMSNYLMSNLEKLGIEASNNMKNSKGKRVRGFIGLGIAA